MATVECPGMHDARWLCTFFRRKVHSRRKLSTIFTCLIVLLDGDGKYWVASWLSPLNLFTCGFGTSGRGA